MWKYLSASPADMRVGSWWYLTGTNISVILFCVDGNEKKGWTEMKKLFRLSDKTSTAQVCAEDHILGHLIHRTRFCLFVLNDK